MEANPVLPAAFRGIKDVQERLRQSHQAVQHWEEVVTACRLRRCAAWEDFLFSQGVQARQRQARRRRCIRCLQILWEQLPGRRWWVYPRSSDWWDNFVMRIWGEEKWLENFRMSRSTFNWLVVALRDVLQRQRTEMRAPVSVERRVAVALWWMASTMSYRTVGHQFGLARSTVAGIVVEVTRAITEALLDRVVYLRDPDKVLQGHRGGCQPQRARGGSLVQINNRTQDQQQDPMGKSKCPVRHPDRNRHNHLDSFHGRGRRKT
ncbi:UNVERIFIED_CONTAM: hypothetical protein K2H54_040044 [Gekko kuhli]